MVEHASPCLVDPAAAGLAVGPGAARQVLRHRVNRDIAGLRCSRTRDLGFVIAGCKRLAGADADPVETVTEKGGRILGWDCRCFGADRIPGSGGGQAGPVLSPHQRGAASPESLQCPPGVHLGSERRCRRKADAGGNGIGGRRRYDRYGPRRGRWRRLRC